MFNYDANGNQLSDGLSNNYAYDAENRINNGAGVTYVYDGDGERVQKSGGTTYWGGGSGGALMESDNNGTPTAEYIFFNGQRIARRDVPSGAVSYYFSDHLGSASIITDAAGNVTKTCDYAPYGELHLETGSDPNHYKFTGKERDTETGLDYFGARYYGSNIGRFVTPDVDLGSMRVIRPQSLNRYSYVLNSPLVRIDTDGRKDNPSIKLATKP